MGTVSAVLATYSYIITWLVWGYRVSFVFWNRKKKKLKKKDVKDLVLIKYKSLRFLVFPPLTHLKDLFIFVSGSHIEGMCN